MRIALIFALFLLPVAFHLAAPPAVYAQKPKSKAKKGAAKAKAKEPKTPVREKDPEPEPAVKAEVPQVAPVELRGPTRIDFDDRLIQGQTNKSGAVYLFDRKETGINSMVKRRKTFRNLTLSTIYDR